MALVVRNGIEAAKPGVAERLDRDFLEMQDEAEREERSGLSG